MHAPPGFTSVSDLLQAGGPQPSAEHTALSNPGNMYGLQASRLAHTHASQLRTQSPQVSTSAPRDAKLRLSAGACPDAQSNDVCQARADY